MDMRLCLQTEAQQAPELQNLEILIGNQNSREMFVIPRSKETGFGQELLVMDLI